MPPRAQARPTHRQTAAAGPRRSSLPASASPANHASPLEGAEIDLVDPSIEQIQAGPPLEVSAPPVSIRAPAAVVLGPASTTSVEKGTYDAQDAEVTPPELLSPRRIRSWPAGSDRDVALLEVVVNEKGTVDGVKSRLSPRTVAESISLITTLSVVHTWRFRPAERNGHSVRYRLLIVRSLL
jgi:hypothetical protein